MKTNVLGLVVAAFLGTGAAQAAMTHRYSFNDGTANDSVGGANGTLMNGAAVSGGQLVFSSTTNNGVNTDPATGQYVQLPGMLITSGSFTVETWLTMKSRAAWQRVVDFGNHVTGPLVNYPNIVDGSTNFLMMTYTGSYFLGQFTANSDTPETRTDNYVDSLFQSNPLNVQLHLVWVHDLAAGVENFYVNGARSVLTPRAATMDPSSEPTVSSYTGFYIGRSNFAQDPFFSGSINELRFYDSALTAATVSADFAAGPNVVPEPGALGLLAGALTLGILRCRRTR